MTDTCKRGHPWDDANTYIAGRTVAGTVLRSCKACRRLSAAKYRDARKLPRLPVAPLLALQGTQSDGAFAAQLGVTRETVWRWRHRGAATTSWSVADKAAAGLGRQMSDIWPDDA